MFGDIRISYLFDKYSPASGALSHRPEALDPVEARLWTRARARVRVRACASQAVFSWKWLNWVGFWHRNYPLLVLHCLEGNSCMWKITVFSSGALSQTMNLEKNFWWHVDCRKCCQLSSMNIACLWHWASTFVCNTIGSSWDLSKWCLLEDTFSASCTCIVCVSWELVKKHLWIIRDMSPSGCSMVAGVVVGVCNRSQMRTSKCTYLIFGVSIGLDHG